MRTFKRLFALLAMLFCCSTMFANYYYCEVLTGSKVITVGNPKYTPDNGESPNFERTVAKRSYLSLTPYAVTDDMSNARLYKADSVSEVEKLVKNEVNRINAELKAKTFAYIDANRNKTQNIDNAKKFIGTKKTNSDSIDWSPMSPLDFVGNAKNYHYEIVNTSKESYWEHEEYLNCSYLIKFRDNDRYLNDRGRFAKRDSAKVFETYADVKNAYQNCEMKDECEVVRNL